MSKAKKCGPPSMGLAKAFSVRLTEDQELKLRKIVKSSGLSRGEVIRQTLDHADFWLRKKFCRQAIAQ